LADALASTQVIEYPFGRASALGIIAKAQAEIGDDEGAKTLFANALATARGIDGPSERDQSLEEIATVHASVGKFADALAIAATIEAWRHSSALAAISLELARQRPGASDDSHVRLATARTEVAAERNYKQLRVEPGQTSAWIQVPQGGCANWNADGAWVWIATPDGKVVLYSPGMRPTHIAFTASETRPANVRYYIDPSGNCSDAVP
jgi:hypothetical protein